MKADEKRILGLAEGTQSDDVRESDIPLVRAGLLSLTSCYVEDGGLKRNWMWVDPHPDALRYMNKHKRLTPAHSRTLRDTVKGKIRQCDVDYARQCIEPKY